MTQENSSFAEDVNSGMNNGGAKSRRQSAVYNDVESPAQNQYIQSVQGQQPFSPASQRMDTGGHILPGAAGMQLQVGNGFSSTLLYDFSWTGIITTVS